MNTILKIIEKHGGLEALKTNGHLKIENPPYMALSIDYLCDGPHKQPMIAVAHNYEQNGDIMADPDMQLEIGPDINGELTLYPISYQNDGLGIAQSVYVIRNGQLIGYYSKLKKELSAFLKVWEKNLCQQGFLTA